MKKSKALTNKAGKVRELTKADIKAMRPVKDVLPRELSNTIANRKQGRGIQKSPGKI
jgi:hypothetical protein